MSNSIHHSTKKLFFSLFLSFLLIFSHSNLTGVTQQQGLGSDHSGAVIKVVRQANIDVTAKCRLALVDLLAFSDDGLNGLLWDTRRVGDLQEVEKGLLELLETDNPGVVPLEQDIGSS